MRTPLQIAASRANGGRSRGPVTAAGKLASARNAVKHGLLSEHVLLRGEKLDTFLNLTADLYDEFQPSTAFERSLVDSMATARWRQRRIWNIEREAMDARLAAEHDKNRAAQLRPAVLTALAFGGLANDTRTLDLVNRYETRFDRQYLRAHRRLVEVQDRRLKSSPTPACGPQLVPPRETSQQPETEPVTRSVSAENSSNTKRTQAAARPYVRIRYRRRPFSQRQTAPEPKSPLPVDTSTKNS
jgi:hypothetical protein